MPELPEVETIRRELSDTVCGKQISKVELLWPQVVKNLPPEEFSLRLKGDRFRQVERRGKYLLLRLESGQVLVIHLRMTGKITYLTPGVPREKHTHLIFHLKGRHELRFVDQRKFGEVHLLLDSQLSSFPPLKKLGAEPLSREFDQQTLSGMLKHSDRKLKEFLLDQTKVAGIGNIYADEALFLARLSPLRLCSSLLPTEVKRLYRAIRSVLARSIRDQGRTFSHYRTVKGEKGDYHPLIHDDKLELCSRCLNPIKRARVGGRGTYYCPNCQK